MELLAVYSRSQASADALAAKAKSKPQCYYDNSPTGHTLDDLLQRKDIDAVIICLPITSQPAIIRKALAAGKHVLSEKPIAPDAATAMSLIRDHEALATKPIWAVAENFRFLPSLQAAADKIKEIGGELTAFHLIMNGYVSESDEFYNTECMFNAKQASTCNIETNSQGRKTPQYQGGFLLDGGVHFLAGLRFLLDAAGDEVQQVVCFSSLLEKRLGPVDSIHAVAKTHGGINGTVSISFGTEFKSTLEICIVTREGRVTFDPSHVVSVRRASGTDSKPTEDKTSFEQDFGVVHEVAAFTKSIITGTVDAKQSPQEAYKDLSLLESLLDSGTSYAPRAVL